MKNKLIKPLIGVLNGTDSILKRRSVRKFDSTYVLTEEETETILLAMQKSPSAHNYKPLSFIVIKDFEIRKKLALASKHSHMLEFASLGILVLGDTLLEPNMEYLQQDGAAAIENGLIMINNLDLGAVWCGTARDSLWYECLRETLNIPSNMELIGLIVIGKKINENESNYFLDLDKIHFNKWGK